MSDPTTIAECDRCGEQHTEPACPPRKDADYCMTVHMQQGRIKSFYFPEGAETRTLCTTWCITHKRWIGSCAYEWFLLAKKLDPTAHRDTLRERTHDV